MDWLDQNKDSYDQDNVTFDGGSYSGLQSLRCMQRHHKRFKNIIAYNPVAAMPVMMQQTDIPEWIISEGLGADRVFDITKDISEADM